jgi:hypothetical protein
LKIGKNLIYDANFSIVVERKYRKVKIIFSESSRFETSKQSHGKQKGITYWGEGIGGSKVE